MYKAVYSQSSFFFTSIILFKILLQNKMNVFPPKLIGRNIQTYLSIDFRWFGSPKHRNTGTSDAVRRAEFFLKHQNNYFRHSRMFRSTSVLFWIIITRALVALKCDDQSIILTLFTTYNAFSDYCTYPQMTQQMFSRKLKNIITSG